MLTLSDKNLYTLAIDSPWGWWQISTTEETLTAVEFIGQSTSDMYPTEPRHKLEKQLHCMLSRYFQGENPDFTRIPVDFSGLSPFSVQVLQLLRTVQHGETRSYQWLAEQAGKPSAARAVGSVMGRNPWPIIIPCHRIVPKSGVLGGFMRNCPGGTIIKAGLLALEGRMFSETSIDNVGLASPLALSKS
jgi:methylated-DNA-[protein]-cysteine S-methyltransferase